MTKIMTVLPVLTAMFLMSPAECQSIPGTTPSSPENIGGRTPLPELLPGRDNSARWQLVTSRASSLIGMSKPKVQSIFGKGAERVHDELTYQITKGNARKAGEVACIELRIRFQNGRVEEYSISALRWL